MKKYKKLSSLLAILMVMITLLGVNTVHAAEPSNTITGEQAQIIAITHIQSSLLLSENETLDNWHWGISISEPVPMYDLAGNVSSHYFSLSDENGTDAGYIVIGSNSSYAPVVEYATSGSFYPAEALEAKNLDKIYYTGGIDYLIGNGEVYMDVSTFGDPLEATDKVSQSVSAYSIDDYLDEWAMWNNMLSAPATRSNPPTSGGAITKPDTYETGYQTKDAKNITGYGLTYKVMNDFDASNHCAPTAATNIMYYWYNRSSSTYGALRKDGDSTWNASFNRFHSLMGTTDDNGTPNANLKDAYTTYYKDAGFSPSVAYYSSASWSNMKTELDNDYPFHIIVQGHYMYGDHSMVAVGYEEYKYSTFSYSRYIRVVDGWISSSGRYIHTSVGSSQVRMVKVRPS